MGSSATVYMIMSTAWPRGLWPASSLSRGGLGSSSASPLQAPLRQVLYRSRARLGCCRCGSWWWWWWSALSRRLCCWMSLAVGLQLPALLSALQPLPSRDDLVLLPLLLATPLLLRRPERDSFRDIGPTTSD